jgi:hypothetical protein
MENIRMARRQPYQQSAPMPSSSAPVEDNALETMEGGLEITLSDADFGSQPFESDPPPQQQEASKEPAYAPPAEAAPQPAAEPAQSADDEAFARLKAQLERSEREHRQIQNRLGQYEKERSSYEESLRAERERSDQFRREHLVSQELAIDNALRVAEREAAAAQDTIQRALENADYEAAAKAQSALTQAYNDIGKLREGKTALELEKARPDKSTPPHRQEEQRQEGGATEKEPQTEWERIEAYITQPAHPPKVQAYMRQHYDDLFANNGARVNALIAAHYDAKARGLPDFSDDYFKHVDNYMGYSKQAPAAQSAGTAPPQAAKQRAPIPPAAPVSRSAASNNQTGTSITLTPAQVQFCRDSGIDPKAYARRIVQLNRASSDPNYTGVRWTKDMGI